MMFPFLPLCVDELIKLALKVSSPMQGTFCRREENQCYYCLYGISLSVSRGDRFQSDDASYC